MTRAKLRSPAAGGVADGAKPVTHAGWAFLFVAASACLPTGNPALGQGTTTMLKLEATVPLPAVKGRIDHLSADVAGKRLFVAALGNDTVEVIDVAGNRHERSVRGFGEPQGVLYVPSRKRLYVANGNGNRVDILDADTFEVRKRIDASDADNLRFDSAADSVVVGYGRGALRMIDAAAERVTGEIALRAHPESFQLERDGPRAFVNVPDAHEVAVVDRVRRATIGAWETPGAAANFPMALDEAGGRLFVGARRPAVLLAYDIATGKVVARLPIGEDTDDVFFDTERKRLYVICGEGRVDVFRQESADRYVLAQSVKTAPRARTGLFVPELRRLYVAAPAAGAPARVLVYAIED
jgi:YVTN family beta-propeller protein